MPAARTKALGVLVWRGPPMALLGAMGRRGVHAKSRALEGRIQSGQHFQQSEALRGRCG